MRVLILTNHQLSGNGGGAFASRAYINSFAAIADYTTVIYPAMDNGDTKIDSTINTIAIDKCNVSRLRSVTNVLMSKLTHFRSTLESELKRGEYTHVVFDNSRTSFRLIELAKSYGAAVITIHHNYEYDYIRDNITGLRRLIYLFWVRRYEREAIERSDLNITLTKQDRDLFINKFNTKNNPIENVGCFEFCKREDISVAEDQNTQQTFVITGNLSSRQSEESLLPWIEEYYPLLKSEISSAKVIVAGKNPSQKTIEITKSNSIELIASPISMDEIIDRAAIYISPTNMGGGIKLRVMDGLRRGLQVVCHKVSSRGYEEFVESGYMLVYDDKNSFINAIKELNNKTVEKNKIVELYNSIFRFESGVERLKNTLLLHKLL